MHLSANSSIHYIHFDLLDSTNNWAKEHADQLDSTQLTCITALEQTAGRGRFQRKWISPKGQNIYATLYFCLSPDCPYVPNLGQVLSLSCCSILKHQGFSIQIKWPNDLIFQGKKIAGILCETICFPDRIGVVLGIGINVNMSENFLKLIDKPATSLAQLSGYTWKLEQILEPLLIQFRVDLFLLLNRGFSHFKPTYEALLANKGQTIHYYNGVESHQGICHSIAEDGKLNLLLPSGQMLSLSSGDISCG